MSFKAFKTGSLHAEAAMLLRRCMRHGDEATSGSGSSSSSSTTGYDVSGIKKDASTPPCCRIRNHDGKPTVGMELTHAPAEFQGRRQDPVGYDVDLSNALGKVFGLTPKSCPHPSIRLSRRLAASMISASLR